MLANAVFSPIPNWGYETRSEVIVWGVCLSMAALLFGFFVIAHIRGKPATPWVIVIALAYLVVCVFAATKSHTRQANERREQMKKDELKALKPKQEPALIVPHPPSN
jgi:cobalamin biosynthesis protein CobD/CbiB